MRATRPVTTVQEMAVTETGHLAAREVDDLYRRHGAEVYRYAYAVLGNHADAEDVTQTTFLNAYRALEQGVRPRKPSNWLLTIASNAIKQRFRQEQARPRLVELDEHIAGQESDDDGPSVGELLTALSKIPPQQRQAIVLREFEGRSYSEIAEILGVDDECARDAPLQGPAFARGRAHAPAHVHRGAARHLEVGRRTAWTQGAQARARPPHRVPRLRAVRAPPAASQQRAARAHAHPDSAVARDLQRPRWCRNGKRRDHAGRRRGRLDRSRCRNGWERCDGDGRWPVRRRSRDQGSGGRRGRQRRRGRRRDRRIRAREIARQDPPGCDQAGAAPRPGRAPRGHRPGERSRAWQSRSAGTDEEGELRRGAEVREDEPGHRDEPIRTCEGAARAARP